MANEVQVTQLGARLHYGAARALHNTGALASLVTDLYIPGSLAKTKHILPALARYCGPIPSHRVKSNTLVGLDFRIRSRFSHALDPSAMVRAAKSLNRASIRELCHHSPKAIYAFDTHAVELFEDPRSAELTRLLEQCIAPRPTQIAMLDRLRHLMEPAYYQKRVDAVAWMRERETREQESANLIVCASRYVKRELVASGVEPAKIEVVPYGFDATGNLDQRWSNREARLSTSTRLRALFVGGVDYRKGVHDLAAVATTLRPRMDFSAFGKVLIPERIAAPWLEPIGYAGKQPFDVIRRAYNESDVFVLPSYLEGSATVVYEAMAHGLPCIVTEETGSLVRHRESGLVIKAGDQKALRSALEELEEDRELLRKMSRAAIQCSATFRIRDYEASLARVLARRGVIDVNEAHEAY